MRNTVILLLLALPMFMLSVTRTVSLDGTQQYTSIQAAIDDCFFSGDIVLVYPGRYVENLNTNGRRLTLASLHLNDPQQSYIDSTIIDGNLNSCISIISGETVTIRGFTLVNNEQNSYTCPYGAGGGIYIAARSTVNVTSCIIRNCISWYGGGLSVGGHSSLTLSDVNVYNNVAIVYGGGIGAGETQSFIFDEQNRCSVYNNIAPFGMDIIITYVSYTPVLHEVYLAMGSIAMTAADNYFIVCRFADIAVDAQTGYLEQVDADLYVSPTGSDDNSGLSAAEPMQTIALAMQKISSGPANPRTLHLASGTYSHSGNGQILPFSIKSNIKLIGAGTAETIIDGELDRAFIGGSFSENFEVSGISFVNSRGHTAPIELVECSHFRLSDLVFSNTFGRLRSGIFLNECSDAVLESIIVGQISMNDDISSLFLAQCGTVYINNHLSYEHNIQTADYDGLGAVMYDSDVVFRNSVFANNTAQDAWLFLYQTIYPQYADRNLDMSNVLFMNNTVSNVGWVFSPIYMQNRFQPIKVNNVTIANNVTNTTLTKIFAYADVRNLISHNPGSAGELYLRNYLSAPGVQAEVNISNSLFRSNSVNADLPGLVTFNECIFGGNPLFLGSVTDSLDVSQPEYYYLSEGSPCINTGTADTTGMNLPLTDLAGNQRVWDGRIDMGCYEYGAPPVSNDNPELPILSDGISLSLYPNPVYANGSKGSYSFIEFTLPNKAKEPPIVEIYNLKGQRVRSITISQSYNDLVRQAGLSKQVSSSGEFYSTVFDCKDERGGKLTSGIYIIRVMADGSEKAGKLTLLK